MRKTIIAGNWKMYKNLKDGQDLAVSLRRDLYKIENVDIVICPPFTLLAYLADALETSNIGVGGQDLYWQEEGAFTGEVSPMMLKDAGCQYVIIGHSERRQFFGETNETVNKKIKAALKCGLTPIVCVGENLQEREANKTFKVIEDHVNNGLSGISASDMLKLVVAYEPVWAIGTEHTAPLEHSVKAISMLREVIGRDSSILYGGSVNDQEIDKFAGAHAIDGVLVGSASLRAGVFTEICKKWARAKSFKGDVIVE